MEQLYTDLNVCASALTWAQMVVMDGSMYIYLQNIAGDLLMNLE